MRRRSRCTSRSGIRAGQARAVGLAGQPGRSRVAARPRRVTSAEGGRGGGPDTRSVTAAGPNRWVILAGYGLLAACTQLLWLTFAPITTQAHRAMGVSAGAVGDLAGIFPLMYVILALPSGRWLDARFGQG